MLATLSTLPAGILLPGLLAALVLAGALWRLAATLRRLWRQIPRSNRDFSLADIP